MNTRLTRALMALAATGAIAVPAVAQASGGSDDPPNHEQREHQVEHQRVHHHRMHHRGQHDRRDDRVNDR